MGPVQGMFAFQFNNKSALDLGAVVLAYFLLAQSHPPTEGSLTKHSVSLHSSRQAPSKQLALILTYWARLLWCSFLDPPAAQPP